MLLIKIMTTSLKHSRLAVQYEMQTGKMKFKFTLSKINYSLVPESKFEIPKSGYRVLTYEETKNK